MSQLANYSLESKSPPSSVQEPTVPLICIPTSLSGGEYFSLGGGTDDTSHHKQGFLQPGMGAKLVILDAELCLSTPEYYWLSTGVRSVDHCVEALCSLEATSTSDKDAEEGLRLLVPSLLKCKKDPDDVEARHNCHMGVLLAMKSIRGGIPMGGSHAIGHQLGPLGVPHGVTSCIMCPAVMKYNIKHAGDQKLIQEKQKRILAILWSEPSVADVLEKAGLDDKNDLGDVLRAIIGALDMPSTLKQVGIKEDQIPPLSERALDDFWAKDNPIPLTEASQVREILEMVVG